MQVQAGGVSELLAELPATVPAAHRRRAGV